MTDLDLTKFKEKDEAALADFVKLIEPRIRKVVAATLEDRPQSDIDEVVDDVLVRIFSNLDYFFQYDVTEKIIGVCQRMARNSAVHHLRQLTKLDSSAEEYEEQLEKLALTQHKEKLSEETSVALTEILSQMSTTDRRLVEMYFQSGMTLREISTVLGISTATASSKFSRILRHMQTALSSKEEHRMS
jgi:RNA polymerase sigma factor (sigma-70 family)